jgi:hypothetical protein
MKLALILSFIFISITASAQTVGTLDKSKKVDTVQTSCGKCKFGMEGKSCELAIKINGKAFYVDGAAIDDFGDAHADDGFCNSIRQATVQGEVVNGKFKASYVHLLPEKKKQE